MSIGQAQPRLRGHIPPWLRVLITLLAVAELLALLLLTGGVFRATPAATNQVTLRAGDTLSDSLGRIADATGISLTDLQSAVAKPENLGLPLYSNGEVEGLLFPGTYDLEGGASAQHVLSLIVDRFELTADSLVLVKKARQLGRSPFDVVTIASLVETAGPAVDHPKLAQVMYNRLAARMPLQLESTDAYQRKEKKLLRKDLDDPQIELAYSTFRNRGLPPTPIGSPSREALAAALSPAPGNYRYFVTPDEGGESLITSSASEYLNARSPYLNEGVVVDIIDGDSIVVRLGSKAEEVRLLGVDSPERGECYYSQSLAATRKWLKGKRVALTFDRYTDRSDGVRLFAYLEVNSRPINIELVRSGHAHEREYGSTYERRSEFLAAERKAYHRDAGFWGAC